MERQHISLTSRLIAYKFLDIIGKPNVYLNTNTASYLLTSKIE